jgi:2-oxoglutarate ferredoxin oxidoreductase subunit gamma
MLDRYEIRLAGTGGQGMILAGVILAEAAIRDGKNVVQTQSYGPEARGGASRSEVIIANGEIDYPEVIRADILLCMSQEACDSYYKDLKRNGLLIVDASQVTRTPRAGVVKASFTSWALEETERPITASVLALGFLAGMTRLVSKESLEDTVRARTPKGTSEINIKALQRGWTEGQALR